MNSYKPNESILKKITKKAGILYILFTCGKINVMKAD